MFVVAILAAVLLPVCSLLGWWLWLRFARHVVDHHGLEGLDKLPRVAEGYRAQGRQREIRTDGDGGGGKQA